MGFFDKIRWPWRRTKPTAHPDVRLDAEADHSWQGPEDPALKGYRQTVFQRIKLAPECKHGPGCGHDEYDPDAGWMRATAEAYRRVRRGETNGASFDEFVRKGLRESSGGSYLSELADRQPMTGGAPHFKKQTGSGSGSQGSYLSALA